MSSFFKDSCSKVQVPSSTLISNHTRSFSPVSNKPPITRHKQPMGPQLPVPIIVMKIMFWHGWNASHFVNIGFKSALLNLMSTKCETYYLCQTNQHKPNNRHRYLRIHHVSVIQFYYSPKSVFCSIFIPGRFE